MSLQWQSGSGNLPDGGTTGQVLAKKSDSNQDVEWKDANIPVIVGSDWGVAKVGSNTLPINIGSVTIDISDLDLSSASDYDVFITPTSTNVDNDTVFYVTKTNATKFTVGRYSSSGILTFRYVVLAKGYGGSISPYSTTEQEIGRWIDGKPLYQKVCVYNVAGQCAVNTWTDLPVPNLPTNIETHVDVIVSNGSNTIPMAAGVLNDKLRYYANAAYGWTKLYITLKYTKN